MTVSPGLLQPAASLGLQAEVLIDSGEFWPRLRDDIAGARRRVLVEAMSFEGDRSGTDLVDALERSRVPDRRVLIDSFTRYMINDQFLLSPRAWRNPELMAEQRATAELFRRMQRAGVGLRFTNPAMGPIFFRFPVRNHKKLVVIDDEVAYLGGINFSDHNYAWHDLMLRLEHPGVAALLTTDFGETWHGRGGRRHGSFDGLDLHLLDGLDNAAGFAPVLGLIDGARRKIFVESPYVTFPFLDRLVAAGRRGVEVVWVTPELNNWGQYRHYLAAEPTEALQLRSYSGNMTHLKGLLVDDEALVLGSSNFDFFSYAFHHEVLAVVTDPAVIEAFQRRVVEPDLAASRPMTARGPRWWSAFFKLELAILERVNRALGPGPVSAAPEWSADPGSPDG